MGFAVCNINFNLVMESVTRKGRGFVMSLINSMAFFVMRRGRTCYFIKMKRITKRA